ncbi:leucine-rich repeat-containing protein 49 isoform X2 [Anthonomus grandis grandis]|uniref:leucine-rich repeat-containing protein 49 isoform X2 n=1 Tax=Anthonomus grandis grandis TaxID=2921223 RepID=UPI002165630C|nr:leucine-rich repeat-containing protein 49 isoform X2 [Anthonomus grandis grandis]
MPTSSAAATDKKKSLRLTTQKSTDPNGTEPPPNAEKHLLKIAPALPPNNKRSLYVRSHSTLNAASIAKVQENSAYDCVALQPSPDGFLRVSRTQNEKEKHPDRISLDRRGLTHVPVIEGEPRLRLLSLQHNLIIDLETLCKQKFPTLVFLDVYDNQLEQIKALDSLENLRVLLMGKNRLKKIEGLEYLKKLEVLDLHGNQITTVAGLSSLAELKVLNLAGNQIRVVGVKDLQGLDSLQELNLRRNRLKKLLGCGDLNCLVKIFLSNNDLQSVDDISSIAKSPNIKEISIDGNPVFLAGDCVSFLVSYLPHLIRLNAMQVTEQVRKAAMAWRRNKENTNAAFMDLTSETTLNYRREEVISNARTNWELLRSQTKCLTNTVTAVDKSVKNLKPDSDFILTSLAKPTVKPTSKLVHQKSKSFIRIASKVPLLPDKKLGSNRTASQDTENSQNNSNTSSSANSNEFLKLPPILVPIINKLEKNDNMRDDGSLKHSGSLSSLGPNIDSSSSVASGSERAHSTTSNSTGNSDSSDSEREENPIQNCLESKTTEVEQTPTALPTVDKPVTPLEPKTDSNSTPEDTASNLSTNTSILSVPSTSESEKCSTKSSTNSSGCSRNIKSAVSGRPLPIKCNGRAATAKTKKAVPGSPAVPKDREQGGDYLIEICGRYLNVYGQGALRFIDKPWNVSKANDVTTIKFNYVNFNGVVGFLSKIKHRFPNADHFVFKETNIACLGQLNAISEVQGLIRLNIDQEGNPICEKPWESYAIYRLAHWGLKVINDKEISDDEIKQANQEYKSLSDLVLWSLPDILLQPLLVRLRIDVNHGVTEQNAKKWLLKADPELRSVVSKEALQWKKGSVTQEDMLMRQKAKQHISGLLEEMTNAMNKLKMLDEDWPQIMHEFVQNTLLDYSQLDMYMKQKLQELSK